MGSDTSACGTRLRREAVLSLTPRHTFWIAVLYTWVAAGIAFAASGGDGGPLAITAFAIFLALLALDSTVYYRSGARPHPAARFLEAVGTVVWRPFFTGAIGVVPVWIAGRVLG